MNKLDSLLSDIDELEEGDERQAAPEGEDQTESLSDKASKALGVQTQLTDPDRYTPL